jgi:RNA polymerase II-associated factor 1
MMWLSDNHAQCHRLLNQVSTSPHVTAFREEGVYSRWHRWHFTITIAITHHDIFSQKVSSVRGYEYRILLTALSIHRTEHIERIRYPNPLPLPPYPPKLLAIPTPSSRYADPRTFGSRLATAHPLPMVVNSEAGMPLNMTDFPQAWYTDQEIEADENIFPQLASSDDVDAEDAFLLSDLLGKLPSSSNTLGRGTGTGKEIDKGQVTWLRRTEYLGAEKKRKEQSMLANRSQAEVIDSSREAQLAKIKEAFSMANQPLSAIRHPTKPGLRAVEEHQLLPDPDTWATRYDVFRFGDPPGRTIVSMKSCRGFHDVLTRCSSIQNNKPVADIRLQAAILRPHNDSLDRGIVSLFLVDAPEKEEEENGEHETGSDGEESRPKKSRKVMRSREEEIQAQDDQTRKLLEIRKEGDARDGHVQDLVESDPFEVHYDEEDQRVHMNHVRDYEPHDESNRKDQEVVFTFIDSQDSKSQGHLPPITQFEQSFRRKRPAPNNGVSNGSAASSSRKSVVYYHPVSTRASLRVRRKRVS